MTDYPDHMKPMVLTSTKAKLKAMRERKHLNEFWNVINRNTTSPSEASKSMAYRFRKIENYDPIKSTTNVLRTSPLTSSRQEIATNNNNRVFGKPNGKWYRQQLSVEGTVPFKCNVRGTSETNKQPQQFSKKNILPHIQNSPQKDTANKSPRVLERPRWHLTQASSRKSCQSSKNNTSRILKRPDQGSFSPRISKGSGSGLIDSPRANNRPKTIKPGNRPGSMKLSHKTIVPFDNRPVSVILSGQSVVPRGSWINMSCEKALVKLGKASRSCGVSSEKTNTERLAQRLAHINTKIANFCIEKCDSPVSLFSEDAYSYSDDSHTATDDCKGTVSFVNSSETPSVIDSPRSAVDSMAKDTQETEVKFGELLEISSSDNQSHVEKTDDQSTIHSHECLRQSELVSRLDSRRGSSPLIPLRLPKVNIGYIKRENIRPFVRYDNDSKSITETKTKVRSESNLDSKGRSESSSSSQEFSRVYAESGKQERRFEQLDQNQYPNSQQKTNLKSSQESISKSNTEPIPQVNVKSNLDLNQDSSPQSSPKSNSQLSPNAESNFQSNKEYNLESEKKTKAHSAVPPGPPKDTDGDSIESTCLQPDWGLVTTEQSSQTLGVEDLQRLLLGQSPDSSQSNEDRGINDIDSSISSSSLGDSDYSLCDSSTSLESDTNNSSNRCRHVKLVSFDKFVHWYDGEESDEEEIEEKIELEPELESDEPGFYTADGKPSWFWIKEFMASRRK